MPQPDIFIGARGCRILVPLLHEKIERGAGQGIASRCSGGGMGGARAVQQ